jgi:hypothetical protein
VVFSAPELERLRQQLVAMLSQDAPHGLEGIGEALRMAGFGDMVAELLGDPLLAGHRALGADAPAEDLQELWRENVAVVRLANERAAADAGDREERAGGDEAMARRRLLKLAELGEADGDERD